MTQGSAVEERVQEPEAPEAPRCRHHWLIDSPQGATSWGTCKLCGERREFSNSASDALWERDPLPIGREEPIVTHRSLIGSLIGDDEGF